MGRPQWWLGPRVFDGEVGGDPIHQLCCCSECLKPELLADLSAWLGNGHPTDPLCPLCGCWGLIGEPWLIRAVWHPSRPLAQPG